VVLAVVATGILPVSSEAGLENTAVGLPVRLSIENTGRALEDA
jgi:hypothetical protein